MLTESQNNMKQNLGSSPFSAEKLGQRDGIYQSSSSNRYNISKENDEDYDNCEIPEKYAPQPMDPTISEFAI